MKFDFFAEGTPAPQGSKRIGRNRATGRPIVLDDNDAKLSTWRGIVTHRAVQAVRNHASYGVSFPIEGGLRVRLTFTMPRPKTVTRRYPSVKPDVDKLARAVLDALTVAKLYRDDAQVLFLDLAKLYADEGEQPGVHVHVETFGGGV